MIDIQGLFDSLLDASWRGLTFAMPDSRHGAGRRLLRTLFPGRDGKASQDLGPIDAPLQIRGLVVGDDYVHRARRLEAAFRTAGPGLLVHPWLGEVLVILTEPAIFTFTQGELRAVRFQASFEFYNPRKPPPADTLSKLLDAWEDLQAEARALLAAVLAPIALTLAAIGAVESFCSQVVGVFDQVVGVDNALADAARAPVAGYAAIGALPVDATYPGAVAAVLAAPSAAISATSASVLPSAIGPGDLPTATAPIDAAISTAALLTANALTVALGTNTSPTGALALAQAALILADAISASSDLTFASQQEAEAWLARLLAAIDATAALAITTAANQQLAAALVWRSLQRLRAAVAADIGNIIGRLPKVQIITLNDTMPVWLVAQSLAGDTPSKVLAMYSDLVSRNAIAHPAMAGPGDIEALAS